MWEEESIKGQVAMEAGKGDEQKWGSTELLWDLAPVCFANVTVRTQRTFKPEVPNFNTLYVRLATIR